MLSFDATTMNSCVMRCVELLCFVVVRFLFRESSVHAVFRSCPGIFSRIDIYFLSVA